MPISYLTDDDGVRIRVEGHDLPGRRCGPAGEGGHGDVHVGLQARGDPSDLLGVHPGDAAAALWSVECTVLAGPAGPDLRGRYVQGRPGGRFLYLSWGDVDAAGTFAMFRRAKLMLDAVDPTVLAAAIRAGTLVGRLGLTDAAGNPLCAAVRPPAITWSPGA
ncbi:DUF5990 family protein [Frankia sp. Ag45/Mut15]|uniref:DUF5990 family protein n=1 Tax=Frankia umida TaxID=573489 RepID=A0ABT0K5L6_9ACTN|nr:DUF5990 family protein [Frankia umida]MCK9878802.1 DUF5990 family protein [Frankia umida]